MVHKRHPLQPLTKEDPKPSFEKLFSHPARPPQDIALQGKWFPLLINPTIDINHDRIFNQPVTPVYKGWEEAYVEQILIPTPPPTAPASRVGRRDSPPFHALSPGLTQARFSGQIRRSLLCFEVVGERGGEVKWIYDDNNGGDKARGLQHYFYILCAAMFNSTVILL